MTRVWPLLAALLGGAYYGITRGFAHLSPISFLWLRPEDRLIYWTGWLSFFHDPWGWPLGRIVSQLDPMGSYISYTDSIPWFSVVMKLIVPFHGQAIQLLGVYLVLIYALFAFFAYKIFELFKLRLRDRFLATLLMLYAPVLIQRFIHIALCSHWLILAAFYLYFVERLKGPKLLSWMVLVFFASATNPYLAAMVVGICLASALARRSFSLAALAVLTALGTFWIFGYFAFANRGEAGFEFYTSDLLAFFNSMGLSRFFPEVRMAPRQYEGFAYMGFGVLVLGLIVVLRRLRRTAWTEVPGLRPLFWVAGIFAFYSFSSHISIAGHTLVTIEWFYRPFQQITLAFRSCGRFIWVLYYLLMLMIVVKIATTASFSRNRTTALLLFGIILQALDLGPAIAQHREPVGPMTADIAPSQWSAIPLNMHRLEFVPEGFPDPGVCKEGTFEPGVYGRFAVFAFQRDLVSNAGLRAHQDLTFFFSECRQQALSVLQSGLKPGVAYVFPERVAGQKATKPSALFQGACREIQGFPICWKPIKDKL